MALESPPSIDPLIRLFVHLSVHSSFLHYTFTDSQWLLHLKQAGENPRESEGFLTSSIR